MKNLKIDILTLFPQMFSGPLNESMIGRARANGLLDIRLHDLRNFTKDKHRKVDDRCFGGGSGMLLMVEPLYHALKKLSATQQTKMKEKPYVIYLSPQGKPLNQKLVKKISSKRHILLL